ncbi:hypothetical protein DSO57_1032381 [Entomophthora muscae]|uniref:Uncharacterized protein n=1 Tax=Entomophthora muscae TaxID=34485 RepID=A0ACC2RF77_9FUNG|nr:hypothetical protein DSO57_1032381 [Entomophthora muscae]
MTANLSKCGSFSKNSRFPFVPSYTYLGFPHYPDGINFAQLTLEKCKKVTSSLTSIFGFADHWPAIVRTSVYRSFFCSQLDYGLPLLCLANSFACSPATTQAIASLKALHKLALAWCIASAITVIAEPEHRMTHLAVRFAKHIESTASTNPICLIRPWTTRGGVITRSRSDNSPGSLLNKLSFAMLARALPVLPIVCGQDAPTLTDCLCAYHYAKFSRKPTTAFITPDACSSGREFYKRANPVCDRVLRIQDPGTLILALGGSALPLASDIHAAVAICLAAHMSPTAIFWTTFLLTLAPSMFFLNATKQNMPFHQAQNTLCLTAS